MEQPPNRASYSGPLVPGVGWTKAAKKHEAMPVVLPRTTLSSLSGLVASRTLTSEDSRDRYFPPHQVAADQERRASGTFDEWGSSRKQDIKHQTQGITGSRLMGNLLGSTKESILVRLMTEFLKLVVMKTTKRRLHHAILFHSFVLASLNAMIFQITNIPPPPCFTYLYPYGDVHTNAHKILKCYLTFSLFPAFSIYSRMVRVFRETRFISPVLCLFRQTMLIKCLKIMIARFRKQLDEHGSRRQESVIFNLKDCKWHLIQWMLAIVELGDWAMCMEREWRSSPLIRK